MMQIYEKILQIPGSFGIKFVDKPAKRQSAVTWPLAANVIPLPKTSYETQALVPEWSVPVQLIYDTDFQSLGSQHPKQSLSTTAKLSTGCPQRRPDYKDQATG